MDGKLIEFPAGRRSARAGPAHPSVAPEPALDVAPDRGDAFALACLEIRPIRGTPVPAPALLRVRERCVQAVVVGLADAGGAVLVAGTSERPVIEGRFEGDRAGELAAHAALAAAAAVRRAQRAGERAFAVSGGLASGRARTTGSGVRVASGSATRLAERLRETAALGQLLLGGADWEDLELETVPRPGVSVEPGETAPVRVLRGTG